MGFYFVLGVCTFQGSVSIKVGNTCGSLKVFDHFCGGDWSLLSNQRLMEKHLARCDHFQCSWRLGNTSLFAEAPGQLVGSCEANICGIKEPFVAYLQSQGGASATSSQWNDTVPSTELLSCQRLVTFRNKILLLGCVLEKNCFEVSL